MSGPQHAGEEPVTGRNALVAWLEQGSKPDAAQWRIGVEHEKIPFDAATLRPVPYDGPRGIGALLAGLTRFGWQEVREGPNLIGLTRGDTTISLEPGGQVELGGAPLDSVHQIARELEQHLREVKTVAGELGIGFLTLGYQPVATRAQISPMPKGRYALMRDYMPGRGQRGLDMMLATASTQASFDFADEADMVRKLRMALALQPVATALFANSPFAGGRPSGNLSERAAVWLDVDPDRAGSLPIAFEPGFGFERYADHALDVPMYFVRREGRYIDATGQSFRAFLAGKLPALPGQYPTLSDWADHLTTIFTDVRLKRVIEMRGADVGPPEMILAVPALWAGLLYDGAALDAACELAAETGGRTVKDIAVDMLAIAAAGLKARARLDESGSDERRYLAPLEEIAASGLTRAERLLALYAGEWQGDVTRVFTECRF